MVSGLLKGLVVVCLVALIVGVLWFGLIKRLSPYASPTSYVVPRRPRIDRLVAARPNRRILNPAAVGE
jgi:hypothetical protein